MSNFGAEQSGVECVKSEQGPFYIWSEELPVPRPVPFVHLSAWEFPTVNKKQIRMGKNTRFSHCQRLKAEQDGSNVQVLYDFEF